ncbi:hypothetical protein [Paenibacillus sp. OV219]|uniref:hypothetical protein n=1 Tax=Paenibacillus sp. OV219 TaxID=1884377 RepID=UPI000B83F4B8|nr:hypothetical protein [Paenibacillus sp. OV219]
MQARIALRSCFLFWGRLGAERSCCNKVESANVAGSVDLFGGIPGESANVAGLLDLFGGIPGESANVAGLLDFISI